MTDSKSKIAELTPKLATEFAELIALCVHPVSLDEVAEHVDLTLEIAAEFDNLIIEHCLCSKPDSLAALAKYVVVQKQREQFGSKKQFKWTDEEYLAQLPEKRREELIGEQSIYEKTRLGDQWLKILTAMYDDGWVYPGQPHALECENCRFYRGVIAGIVGVIAIHFAWGFLF